MRKLLIALAAMLLIYVAAAPYITVHQIASAAEDKDGEAMAEHIDFPSVRQSLKDQMNAMMMKETSSPEMQDNPFAALGVAFAGVLVDKMVDAYITPAGITQLMKGEKPAPASGGSSDTESGQKKEPFEDASMSYESFSKFAVTVRDDPENEIRFILRRRGLGWQLTEILIPMKT